MGKPDRDIGSGLEIDQWDFHGGILTFHPTSGPNFRTSHGEVFWLMNSKNSVGANLYAQYEMDKVPNRQGLSAWIGTVTISSTGEYEYRDNELGSLQHVAGGFFEAHPRGKVQVRYSSGIKPTTLLEDLQDQAVVAEITFLPTDKTRERLFKVVNQTSTRSIDLQSVEARTFLLWKGWNHSWN
ncbi:MAG: hypothetical protein JO317_05275 [Verrucomicrobiae bacterium]|nr:hypothetical protein [Verrucomicrobiae bacterium]